MKPAAPLMECTERKTSFTKARIGVAARLLDAQQLAFDLGQVLTRLVDKLDHEFLIVEHV